METSAGNHYLTASTTPNLGTLCDCKADIYQLDVMDLYTKYDAESVEEFRRLVDTHIKLL